MLLPLPEQNASPGLIAELHILAAQPRNFRFMLRILLWLLAHEGPNLGSICTEDNLV